MRRILVLLYTALAVISCSAYLGFWYFVFGCDGFVAETTKQQGNNQVFFSYGLFQRREAGPNNSSSCKAWTYESILADTADSAVSLRQMQLGQTAAILGLVSSTLYVLLVASNIWFRIPISVMKQLGGSLGLITLLLLAATLAPAVSMPFCNVSSSNSFIECRLNHRPFYAEVLLWLFATIGATLIGDGNVDRVLFRRRNNIEAVPDYPKGSSSDPCEEGTSAPTLDDILMICDGENENVNEDYQIGAIPNESLAECVRSLQSPATEASEACTKHAADGDVTDEAENMLCPNVDAPSVPAANGSYS